MFFKRWVKKEDGTTAVEFSLVATPFILMTVGLIEMSLMFSAQSLLEASVSNATRLIRTGQVQQAAPADQEQMFRDAVCDLTSALINCNDIQIQVVNTDSFSDASGFPPASFDQNGDLEDQGFDPGGSSDVVLIRVAYRYDIATPMMQTVLTNNSDSTRTMMSTIVLRSEPYEWEG